MKQLSLFDGTQRFVLDKPLRLIQLFAGYGSQALALDYLGIPFESWRISEWAIPSIKAYKDLHHSDAKGDYSRWTDDETIIEWLYGRISSNYNTPLTREQIKRMGEARRRRIFSDMAVSRNLGSITKIHGPDLAIEGTDRYTYLLFYSFPCQDLSVAGKGRGCSKGSGTRSGLLWEVERILDELHAADRGGRQLPQVLIAENVPALLAEKNRPDFYEWLRKLESLGYHNYYQTLNAKNFGIPQNRDRVFIVSLLGDYYYDFPAPIPLEHRLKDVLETDVDERYYLKDATVQMYEDYVAKKQAEGCGFDFAPTDGGGSLCASERERGAELTTIILRCRTMVEKQTDIASTLMARDYKGFGNQGQTGVLEPIIFDGYNGRVPQDQDCVGTLTTNCGASNMRGGGGCKLIEPRIAALRGRNPDNPSDRTKGAPTQQRLEIGEEGTSNTLTSVQKDNLVVVPSATGG